MVSCVESSTRFELEIDSKSRNRSSPAELVFSKRSGNGNRRWAIYLCCAIGRERRGKLCRPHPSGCVTVHFGSSPGAANSQFFPCRSDPLPMAWPPSGKTRWGFYRSPQANGFAEGQMDRHRPQGERETEAKRANAQHPQVPKENCFFPVLSPFVFFRSSPIDI